MIYILCQEFCLSRNPYCIVIAKKDILRMQDMPQNKTQVETVNFRLYFKVIIRQNEIQNFTT